MRKELAALPFAVKLIFKYQDGAQIQVSFEYDSYQLAMADVLEVSSRLSDETALLICNLKD